MFVAENIEYSIIYIGIESVFRKAPGSGYKGVYLIHSTSGKSVTIFFPSSFDSLTTTPHNLNVYKENPPFRHIIPNISPDYKQKLIADGVPQEYIDKEDAACYEESIKFDNTQHIIEIDGSVWASPMYKKYLYANLKELWEFYQKVGAQVDYQNAARIISGMEFEVPPRVIRVEDTKEDAKPRGKEAAPALIKTVRAKGKRGKVLEWFIDKGYTGNLLEATIDFDTTRSNILSHLFILNRDHGIGYSMKGDIVELTMPDGCTDPFNDTVSPSLDDDDDWLL